MALGRAEVRMITNRQSGAKGSSVRSWRVVAGLVTVALLVLTIVTVGPVAVRAVS